MHIVDGIFTALCIMMGLFVVLVLAAWWKDGHR